MSIKHMPRQFYHDIRSVSVSLAFLVKTLRSRMCLVIWQDFFLGKQGQLNKLIDSTQIVFQENLYYHLFSIILKLYSVLRKIGKPEFKSLQTCVIPALMMSALQLSQILISFMHFSCFEALYASKYYQQLLEFNDL